MHRLLVHRDELSIDHDLIKLRFHSRDKLIQNIPECEVGAVSLKKRTANFRESRAIENQLPSENGDAVGQIACRAHINGWGWRWICHLRSRRANKRCGAGRRPRCCTTRGCTSAGACSEYAGATQVRVNPFKFRVRVDLRQGLRTDLNDHAFGAFDLLLRVEESRILLERREDRLIQSKSGNPTGRTCSGAGPCFAATKTRLTKEAERCKNPHGKKTFSH